MQTLSLLFCALLCALAAAQTQAAAQYVVLNSLCAYQLYTDVSYTCGEKGENVITKEISVRSGDWKTICGTQCWNNPTTCTCFSYDSVEKMCKLRFCEPKISNVKGKSTLAVLLPKCFPTPAPSTTVPSKSPTRLPTLEPTLMPSALPTTQPTLVPTELPTKPARLPTAFPSKRPTRLPIARPTRRPTFYPTVKVTKVFIPRSPTLKPLSESTGQPTIRVTSDVIPTVLPTMTPTYKSIGARPTGSDNIFRSEAPSLFGVTRSPSLQAPSSSPVSIPSFEPTVEVTSRPSFRPTFKPTKKPTRLPTRRPTTMPSDSPTAFTDAPTSDPTKEPTLPTASPVKHPTLAPSLFSGASPTFATRLPTFRPTKRPTIYEWTSPTGIKQSVPYDLSLFFSPSIDTNLCEIARPRSTAKMVTWTQWGGRMVDCVKECQYDLYCGGIMYSDVAKTCMKMTALETVDDAEQIENWEQEKWVAYAKLTSAVGYYSQYCSTFDTASNCNDMNPFCAWKKGKRGWNQIRVVDLGWCGRLKCVKGAPNLGRL